MKLKSDRFIPDTADDLLRKQYKKQCFAQRTQKKDSHLNKLYRTLILKEGKRDKNKEKDKQENFIKNKSLKCIDFNYNHTAENQNKNTYQYLNLLGLDISNIELGPNIVNKPQKLLVAENLDDDFYLNLIDCSAKSILAVGLSKGIYLWKTSGTIAKLQTEEGLTSLQWSQKKPHLLACGNNEGDVSIYDCEKSQCVARFEGHQDRVGTIGWLNNQNNLLSGGKDNKILLYDLRKSKVTGIFKFHQSQICTIKACMNGNNTNQVFASGSNDKKLAIWNLRMKKPESIYSHDAAVKGIAWHPAKLGIIASGGGSEDRCLRLWDTVQNSMVNCIETGSQICNLKFIKNGNYLVSSHGYNKFETNIWHYQSNDSIIKKQTLIGHTNRVLYLTSFPKGDLIVTGAGDQTIRFWKFNEQKQLPTHKELQDTKMTIR